MLTVLLALFSTVAHAQARAEPGCRRAIVWVQPDATLVKDGVFLGVNPKSYLAGCRGDVFWVDANRSIYVNERLVGNDARDYVDVPYRAEVIWKDGANTLWRNDRFLGVGAGRFEVARYSGDVVWLDATGGIFKNENLIGVATKEFTLYPDGRVHWVDANAQHHID